MDFFLHFAQYAFFETEAPKHILQLVWISIKFYFFYFVILRIFFTCFYSTIRLYNQAKRKVKKKKRIPNLKRSSCVYRTRNLFQIEWNAMKKKIQRQMLFYYRQYQQWTLFMQQIWWTNNYDEHHTYQWTYG